MYVAPKLGTIECSITKEHFVIVRKFKFDMIRQESYWTTVNRLCKPCKSAEQAKAYVERIITEHQVKE